MSQTFNSTRLPDPDSEIQQELSSAVIDGIVEIQKVKVQNEARQLAFREKELDANLELSKKAMDYNLELKRKKPGERRKTLVYASVIVFMFLLLFLGFVGYCLYIGKERFLIEFIRYALYPLFTGAGYYVGRKSTNKREQSPSVPNDAEILADA